jgi:uncharacterized membrane protein
MSPYPLLEADPLMLPYPVKASAVVFSFDLAKRSMRLYMPRTYRDLSSYQVFILSDANARVFTGNQLKWYKDSVANGSGMVMIGGNEAFGGRAGFASWHATPVADVLPVEMLVGEWTEGEVVVVKPDHPFVEALPIKPGLRWMRGYDGNEILVRRGAVELARLAPSFGEEGSTFWAEWVYEEGRTFAISGDWTPAGGTVFMRWEYYGDFAANLMLFLSGSDLPADLETVHQLRTKFVEYRSAKAYLLNVVDFGEKFGAGMDPVFDIVREADARSEEANRAYLELEYALSLERVDLALASITKGVERAISLKDQALIWIFVIEWTAVTGTFAVCGSVLWTLMVRRRLYREMGITRFER